MGFFSKITKAITSPISSIIGSGVSAFGQSEANKASQANSREQMDFQREMRATQYQTSVDDMRKAGLNPMLAYRTGGAGTPPGAAAQAVNEMAAIPESVNSARMSTIQKAQLANMAADTAKKQAETFVSDQTSANLYQQHKILKENLASAKASAAASRIDEALYNSQFGGLIRGAEKLLPPANSALQAGKSVKDLSGLSFKKKYPFPTKPGSALP